MVDRRGADAGRSTGMRITVCVCTFRRPARLGPLLAQVARQRTDGRFTLDVVVADNDARASAAPAVASARERLTIPVTYVLEPRQNIARARNAALARAKGDWVAFIDDDELPQDDWLLQALAAARTFGAHGVLGPVRPLYEVPPPRWLLRGGFAERPEHASGHLLHWRETRTGNVLMRRDVFERMWPPFDPAFGQGGEDTDFFRRAIAAGGRFVWSSEAVVHEHVPAARCRRGYFLRRALLRGQNERGLLTPASVLRSALAVPAYAALLPLAVLAGGHRAMDVAIRLCDHAGRFAALLNVDVVRRSSLG
jgi:succinoglycan biosynthesis protein ExoM